MRIRPEDLDFTIGPIWSFGPSILEPLFPRPTCSACVSFGPSNLRSQALEDLLPIRSIHACLHPSGLGCLPRLLRATQGKGLVLSFFYEWLSPLPATKNTPLSHLPQQSHRIVTQSYFLCWMLPCFTHRENKPRNVTKETVKVPQIG